jgi:hypothetical protein
MAAAAWLGALNVALDRQSAGPTAGGKRRGRRDLPARAFSEDIRPGIGSTRITGAWVVSLTLNKLAVQLV